MLATEELRRLLQYRAASPTLVSLYLSLDKQRRFPRQCQALIQQCLAQEPGLERLDCEEILGYVSSLDPKGHKALALFSSRPDRFWQAVLLPQPVKSLARAGTTPFLAPLTNILDQYQRYGVVLLDAGKARLLEAYLGEIQEHPFLAPAGSRPLARITDPLNRHLKNAADQAMALCRKRSLDRVILAAPADLAPLFAHHLHTWLQDNLIIDAQMDISMAPPHVLERVLQGEGESRKVRESVLVYRLLDAVKSERMGVVGIAETLQALRAGCVRLLLVRDGLARMGRVCAHCGALALSGKKCAYCWLNTEPVLDLVEEMAQAALDQNAEVFRVFHPTRLDTFGGVGAEMSFKSEPAPDAPPQKPPEQRRPLSVTGLPPTEDV